MGYSLAPGKFGIGRFRSYRINNKTLYGRQSEVYPSGPQTIGAGWSRRQRDPSTVHLPLAAPEASLKEKVSQSILIGKSIWERIWEKVPIGNFSHH